MAPQEPAAAIAAEFQNLSKTAAALNSSSDELTAAVGLLDAALQKLNIGLSSWVTFEEWTDERGECGTREQVGYEKVSGEWGISLRRVNWDLDEQETDGPWLFTDSPREMRIASVDKLPELIQELNKNASATVKKVQEKTGQARALAEALGRVAMTPRGKK